MTIDPVCGAEIEEGASATEADYSGNRYYFCSQKCKEQFERHPAQFVDEHGHPTAIA